MGLRHELTDAQWEAIQQLLPPERGRVGRPASTSNRLVVNAILWVLRTGAPWRDLPERYPGWSGVYARFRRWNQKGLWALLLQQLAHSSDDESFMIDSSIVRAHQDASGARRIEGPQAIGRSRGGPTTKIHALVDGLGYPVRLELTPGQAHDVTQALCLLEQVSNANVMADRAYDSREVVEAIEARGCCVVIPSRRCCKHQRTIDKHLYKERFLVENFFQKIKRFRRVAMRFEKLAAHYLAMVTLASVLVWLT
jgi:transposase